MFGLSSILEMNIMQSTVKNKAIRFVNRVRIAFSLDLTKLTIISNAIWVVL